MTSPAHILVVEDDSLIALMIEQYLACAGYRVTKALKFPDALSKAETLPFDAAILDLNLAGNFCYPIAETLQKRGIPFLFASGYSRDKLPDVFNDVFILKKPYDLENLEDSVKAVLASRAASSE